ncbi:alpha-ribazole phosphatase family protein [Psychromonas sp. KJ10-2]|uniref:alpha-ribazole phosphatase family protein n=1 Tax=Psychromonas sp. KJ10-2 TaxID=3391822 RepID=UPI0039B6C780
MSDTNQNNFPIAHNIYLVRHGAVNLSSDICYGQLDCELTDSFEKDLQSFIDYFQNKQLKTANMQIISSPLSRCLNLAKGLQQSLQLTFIPLKMENAFQEINFGEWEGKTWQSIGQQTIEDWNADLLDYQFPKGESARQFDLRVVTAWLQLNDSLLRAKQAQNIVLITHAGVIRSILSHFLKIPLDHALTLKIDKLSVSTLRVVPQQAKLSQCTAINHILGQ